MKLKLFQISSKYWYFYCNLGFIPIYTCLQFVVNFTSVWRARLIRFRRVWSKHLALLMTSDAHTHVNVSYELRVCIWERKYVVILIFSFDNIYTNTIISRCLNLHNFIPLTSFKYIDINPIMLTSPIVSSV